MKVEIKNLYKGGLSEFDDMGNAFNVSDMLGIDLNSKPGIIMADKRLYKKIFLSDQSSFISYGLINQITLSNGKTLFFSKTTGEIFYLNYDTDTHKYYITSVYETVPTSGSVICRGVCEYNGYLYWATNNYLHRIDISKVDGNWGSDAETNWNPLAKHGSSHPMIVQNARLYIGDECYLSEVDGDAFTADILNGNIKSPEKISSLEKNGTDIVIGTDPSSVQNGVYAKSRVIIWNGWSESFSYAYELLEQGVYAMKSYDGYVIIFAGHTGSIYRYHPSLGVKFFRKIKNVSFANDYCYVNKDAICEFKSKILFGLSHYGSGGAASIKPGIYSFGKTVNGESPIVSLEYAISTDVTDSVFTPVNIITDIIIDSLGAVGSDLRATYSGAYASTAVGIDSISADKYAKSPYFTSMPIQIGNNDNISLGKIEAGYASLPSGTDVNFEISVNGGAFTAFESINDTINMRKISKSNIPKCRTLKVKTILTTSTIYTPEVENVIINI